jgi:hypothetical protein
MPVQLASIPNLLKPGLAAIQGADYNQYPAQWSESYTVFQSDKSQEIVQEIRLLSLAQVKAEGTSLSVDNNLGQRATTTYYNRSIGIGYVMTRECLEDNLYQTYFPMANRSLKASMDAAKETIGAALFNNGFNTAFPLADGQPLFSAPNFPNGATGHPYDGGFISNTFTVATPLSEAALEGGINGIMQFRDPAGILLRTKPEKLMVNRQNQWVAERLLGSAFRVGTANNDINALYTTNSIPLGYRVNQYLNQPVANSNIWFIQTDTQGLRHFVRTPMEIDQYTDFFTKNIQVSAFERYSFGCDNFRTVFGSYG